MNDPNDVGTTTFVFVNMTGVFPWRGPGSWFMSWTDAAEAELCR